MTAPSSTSSTSLTALQSHLKKLEDEKYRLMFDVSDDQEIVQIDKDIAALKDRRAQVTKQIISGRSNSIKQVSRGIRKTEKAVEKLLEINDAATLKIKDVIQAMCNGVNWSSKWRCSWLSGSGRYAVLTKSPGTCWNGIGMPRSSVPSEHCLVDVFKMRKSAGNTHAIALLRDIGTIEKVEGRLFKAKKVEWEARVSRLEHEQTQ